MNEENNNKVEEQDLETPTSETTEQAPEQEQETEEVETSEDIIAKSSVRLPLASWLVPKPNSTNSDSELMPSSRGNKVLRVRANARAASR